MIPSIQPILHLLRTNDSTLTELNLNGQPIGDEEAEAIAATLEHNHTLKKLYMRCCDISKDGAIALARGLNKNRTLELLDLTREPNRFYAKEGCGNAGALAFAALVNANKTIKHIILFYNQIEPEVAKLVKQTSVIKVETDDRFAPLPSLEESDYIVAKEKENSDDKINRAISQLYKTEPGDYFYHLFTSYKDAETRLREDGRIGGFIIRYTATNDSWTADVSYLEPSSKIVHILIKVASDVIVSNGSKFNTLEEFFEHYKDKGCLIYPLKVLTSKPLLGHSQPLQRPRSFYGVYPQQNPASSASRPRLVTQRSEASLLPAAHSVSPSLQGVATETPENKINKVIPQIFATEPGALFYHLSISREDAEKRLQDSEIGSFIIRYSVRHDPWTAISYMGPDSKVVHDLIKVGSDGVLKKDLEFKTLEAFFEHYKDYLKKPLKVLAAQSFPVPSQASQPTKSSYGFSSQQNSASPAVRPRLSTQDSEHSLQRPVRNSIYVEGSLVEKNIPAPKQRIIYSNFINEKSSTGNSHILYPDPEAEENSKQKK